jgi:hypothetical protein
MAQGGATMNGDIAVLNVQPGEPSFRSNAAELQLYEHRAPGDHAWRSVFVARMAGKLNIPTRYKKASKRGKCKSVGHHGLEEPAGGPSLLLP